LYNINDLYHAHVYIIDLIGRKLSTDRYTMYDINKLRLQALNVHKLGNNDPLPTLKKKNSFLQPHPGDLIL
jgi:hypothetical protein